MYTVCRGISNKLYQSDGHAMLANKITKMIIFCLMGCFIIVSSHIPALRDQWLSVLRWPTTQTDITPLKQCQRMVVDAATIGFIGGANIGAGILGLASGSMFMGLVVGATIGALVVALSVGYSQCMLFERTPS